MLTKQLKRKRRHRRLRKKIIGTRHVPRLNVYRSLSNFHVQLIDDIEEKTIIGMSTLDKEIRQRFSYGGNVKAAQALGEVLAQRLKDKSIERICFDRGGYQYHGRIKALADVLRKEGIKF